MQLINKPTGVVIISKGQKKKILHVLAEVGVVKIGWLQKGLKCCLKRLKILQNEIWVLHEHCLKKKVS